MEELASYAGHRFDGILGVDFIREFVVEIDWIGKVLTLRHRSAFSYRGKGVSLPVTLDARSHPQVNAAVRLGPGREATGLFLIDIGASRGLTLNSPFVVQEQLLTGERTVVPLRGFGAGGALKGVASRIEGLRIGEWVIKNPIAAFSQDAQGAYAATDKQGSIGAEVLRRFRVILDFGRERIILEPNERFGDPFEHDMSGLALQAVGSAFDSFKVVAVDDGSAAATAGVKVGDVVVTIDGRPASGFDLNEIRRLLALAGQYKLGVRRGEALVAITLVTTRRL